MKIFIVFTIFIGVSVAFPSVKENGYAFETIHDEQQLESSVRDGGSNTEGQENTVIGMRGNEEDKDNQELGTNGDEGKDVYKYPKYQFAYGVKAPHTGDLKEAWEVRDGDHVEGEYSLLEPNGNHRVVKYHANDKSGFNAVVKTYNSKGELVTEPTPKSDDNKEEKDCDGKQENLEGQGESGTVKDQQKPEEQKQTQNIQKRKDAKGATSYQKKE